MASSLEDAFIPDRDQVRDVRRPLSRHKPSFIKESDLRDVKNPFDFKLRTVTDSDEAPGPYQTSILRRPNRLRAKGLEVRFRGPKTSRHGNGYPGGLCVV